MGRELQKKKNRSSIPRHTKRRNPRIHKIKSFGNQIIAQNWNKNETLQQKYVVLGLAVKLNKPTGGVEKSLSTSTSTIPAAAAAGAFPPSTSLTAPHTPLAPGEARIERDADGRITNIIYGATGSSRLDQLEDTVMQQNGEEKPTTEVVKALIESASRGTKVQRGQSEREKEWIERLVEKYGEDYRKMSFSCPCSYYLCCNSDSIITF
ncbi:ribosome biogenesis protein Nop16 [Tirmania nivea]|nr:ribosome biogenesis protein Nop16 [Tirmania nivea]